MSSVSVQPMGLKSSESDKAAAVLSPCEWKNRQACGVAPYLQSITSITYGVLAASSQTFVLRLRAML